MWISRERREKIVCWINARDVWGGMFVSAALVFAVVVLSYGPSHFLNTPVPPVPTPSQSQAPPIPPLAARSIAGVSKQSGYWRITQIQVGSQTLYDRSDRLREPYLGVYQYCLATVTSEFIEIRVSLDGGSGPDRTERVYTTRFAPGGTLRCESIPFDADHRAVLKSIDEGSGHPGIYTLHEDQLVVYICGSKSAPQPLSVPEQLASEDMLYRMERLMPDDYEHLILSSPSNMNVVPGTERDGMVLVEENHGLGRMMNSKYVEAMKSMIEPYRDQPSSKESHTFRNSNGWVVHVRHSPPYQGTIDKVAIPGVEVLPRSIRPVTKNTK